jgi:acyl-CoA thioester hydrolase
VDEGDEVGGKQFVKDFEVRINDCDQNRHLTSSAYLEYAIHTRYSCLHDLGVTALVREAALGPVVFRDEVEYRRELRALDRVSVSMLLAGQSDDGARWRLQHEFVRADGVLAARIRTDGAWLNLRTRKLDVPTDEVAAIMLGLCHTDDFEVLPGHRRRPAGEAG